MNFRLILGVFLMLFAGQLLLAQENYNTLIYEGNKLFEGKNYDASSSKYLDAAKLKNNDFAAHYNLGNALYKKKMYEEAKAEFEKAHKNTTSKEEKAAALYNMGNAYMQTQNSEKAADFYKQALKQDPHNESIRKNFEIAKLKEKEKQNQKQQDQGKGNKDQKDQQQGQNGDKDQKSQQPNGKGNEDKGQGENGDQKKPQNPHDGNQIPKDIENAIMNRVENKERETARRILNKDANTMPQSNEKDW